MERILLVALIVVFLPIDGLTSSTAMQPEDKLAYSRSSQLNLNCSNFTVEQLKTINLARSIAGAISLSIVTLILLFLVLYKAYTSTLQRLFVHLTIVTWLHDASFVIQIEHQFEYPGEEQFCAFVGFFDMWTSTMVYYFIIGINVLLAYTIYKQFQGDPFSRLSNSKYPRLMLECLLTLLMIFLPLAYLLFPFWEDTYGLGPKSIFCWIKDVEKDCNTTHPYSLIRYSETVVLGVTCVVHILITIGIAVAFCRLAHTYQGMKRKHIKNIRDVLLLMCFLLTSVVFDNRGIAVMIGEKVTGNFAFWIFSAVGSPISMVIYPIGFLFYLYSLNKFKWKSIKRAAQEWKTSCGCKTKQTQVHCRRRPVTLNLITNPSSHPPVVPSSSFFVTPHTGAFSDTNDTNEDQPLISQNDTVYNTVINEH